MDPVRIRQEIGKIKDYARRNGAAAAFFRVAEGIKESMEDRRYSESHEEPIFPDPGEDREDTEGLPFISVIIPVCSPDMDDFAHLLDSLKAQSYRNFETVIADGGCDDSIAEVVKAYFEDPENTLRIKYKKLKENKGISENSNEALKEAEGEYVSFLDHDDLLSPDALLESARAAAGGAYVIYTDEDKYDGTRDRYFCPNRKPDFNLDLLLSNNYICHLLTVKKELVDELKGLRSGYDGAQDHDLVLRLSEKVPREKIAHIDRVLYHWRLSPSSTAGNPMSKLYAYENGRKAVQDYLTRRGIGAVVEDTAHRGFFHPVYSGIDVDRESYFIFIDKRLEALTADFERCMAGYFAREEVGIVGAAIIGKTGRTVSNGLKIDKDGRKLPEYGKIDFRFSGYMHRAAMARETEAVSIHAFAIRKELKALIDRDPFRMCEKVREKGYTVVVDPHILFRIK
ncbi:MAG: glycosyltransferase [Lachnospiraceae bacterium]|nr:glycosyltransferase [Lachnospiraceae bacterium]